MLPFVVDTPLTASCCRAECSGGEQDGWGRINWKCEMRQQCGGFRQVKQKQKIYCLGAKIKMAFNIHAYRSGGIYFFVHFYVLSVVHVELREIDR